MKKFKKKSIMMLLCIMLLNVPVVCAYAAQESMGDILEKANLLYDIGIINTEPTEEKLNEKVTRADVAITISRMLGLSEEDVNFITPFTDVHPMSNGAGAIGNVYGLDIMKGFDNEFRPETVIKEQETVKILVMATGYGFNAEASGGYPLGYLTTAGKVGITKGIDITNDAEITYGKFIRLLANTIDVDIQKYVISGNSYEYFTEAGKTVLSEYLDIYFIKGCVIENQYTGIIEPSSIGENKVKIEQDSAGVEIYNTGTTDAARYLGYSVKIYAKEETGSGEKTILNISADTKKTDAVVIDAEDLRSVVPGTSISYYDKTKTVTLKMSQTANVIYNNLFYDKAYNTSEEIFKPDYGTDILIDSDGDGVYETIFISDINLMQVNHINSEEGKIYGKNNEFYDLQASGINAVSIYKDGREVTEKNINTDDVLEIAVSKDSSVYVINIITDKIKGTITSIEENAVEVDGIRYNAVKNTITDDFKTGSSGTFFFNNTGKLIYADIDGASSGIKYAILIAVSTDVADDTTLFVRLFTDNREEIFKTANKITLDGNKCTAKETLAKLRPDATKSVIRQLIRYKINTDNEITFIDTVDRTSKEDGDSLTLSIEKTNLRYYSTGTLYPSHGGFGKCLIDNQTKVFMVGSTLDGNANDFMLARMGNLVSGTDYDIAVYNIDEENSLTAKAVIVYAAEEAKTDSSIFVVSSVIERVANDSDDEIVTGLSGGYKSGIINSMWYRKDNDNMTTLDGGPVQPGDVIQIVASGTEIKNAKRLVGTETAYGIVTDKALVSVYGKITDMNKTSGVCIVNIGTDSEPNLLVVPLNGMSGYKYDADEKEVAIASRNDAEPGTELYVRYRYNDPQEYVLIKR